MPQKKKNAKNKKNTNKQCKTNSKQNNNNVKCNNDKKDNYRTEEERKLEVRKVIEKLNELKITNDFDAIKELFERMKKYISSGEKININIPFPEFGRSIVGILEIDKQKQCMIKIEKNY